MFHSGGFIRLPVCDDILSFELFLLKVTVAKL